MYKNNKWTKKKALQLSFTNKH